MNKRELIRELARQLTFDETGVSESDEGAIQRYGENAWYAVMQEFETDLAHLSDEELAKAAKDLGFTEPWHD